MRIKNKKSLPCLSEKSCSGHLHTTQIDHTIKMDDRTISIPNIEVLKCDRCGERFYPYDSSKKIDLYKEYSGRFMVRLSPECHWKLAQLAKRHHRSLNQEIHYLLENTLK